MAGKIFADARVVRAARCARARCTAPLAGERTSHPVIGREHFVAAAFNTWDRPIEEGRADSKWNRAHAMWSGELAGS